MAHALIMKMADAETKSFSLFLLCAAQGKSSLLGHMTTSESSKGYLINSSPACFHIEENEGVCVGGGGAEIIAMKLSLNLVYLMHNSLVMGFEEEGELFE